MSWYRIKVDMDGDTFLVTSPDFPEVTTFGENMDAALHNARDAIEEAIAARIADGDTLPVPSPKHGNKGYHVQLTTLSFLKAALYMFCREEEVSRAELARRLDWHREQVDRLFRLDHNSRIDQLEAAFRAIGIELSSSIHLSIPEAA